MSDERIKEATELFYKYLRDNGLKRTRQKDLILETFLTTEGHMSVEDLYSKVKQGDGKAGIVTVFRMLKTLTACGIAREISLGDGVTRFEHSFQHPHHDHIICTECHKAIEFASPELERLQEEIVHKYRFQAKHHRLQIYGLCEDCHEERPVADAAEHDTEKVFARDALRMAHSMERRGIDFYREAARRNTDPGGKAVFDRIVREEESHLSEIESDLEQLEKEEKGLEEAPVFLHFDPTELERLVPDLAEYEVNGQLQLDERRSLELAMVLERRAADFFEDFANKFRETQGKRIFEAFAAEERKHYRKISRRAEKWA